MKIEHSIDITIKLGINMANNVTDSNNTNSNPNVVAMNLMYMMVLQMVMTYVTGSIRYVFLIAYEIAIQILRVFSIRHYVVCGTACNTIRSNIKKRGSCEMNGKIFGLVYGKYYIGYIHPRQEDRSFEYFDLITTEFRYNELTNIENACKLDMTKKIKKIDVGKTLNVFKYLDVKITDWWIYPRCRDIISKEIKLTKKQDMCVKKIVSSMSEHNNSCVCYIHGQPGTGKSTLGRILTKILDGKLIVLFNPWDPIEQRLTLSDLISEVNPTVEQPLIILLNEIDITIQQIITNTIQKEAEKQGTIIENNAQKKRTYRKQDWTDMLDMFDNGFFPNVVLIMTSNVDPVIINEKDPAYLRNGRIHVKFCLDEKVV